MLAPPAPAAAPAGSTRRATRRAARCRRCSAFRRSPCRSVRRCAPAARHAAGRSAGQRCELLAVAAWCEARLPFRGSCSRRPRARASSRHEARQEAPAADASKRAIPSRARRCSARAGRTATPRRSGSRPTRARAQAARREPRWMRRARAGPACPRRPRDPRSVAPRPREGRMRELYLQSVGAAHALTDEQLSESLTATLAAKPKGAGWWVFAYGSLLWNPLFPVAEARPAMLRGLHRRFCLWSLASRGTRESPGPGAGARPRRRVPGRRVPPAGAARDRRAAPAVAARDGRRRLPPEVGEARHRTARDRRARVHRQARPSAVRGKADARPAGRRHRATPAARSARRSTTSSARAWRSSRTASSTRISRRLAPRSRRCVPDADG